MYNPCASGTQTGNFGTCEWLKTRNYFVAVVGGAISGSVAAEILADRGIRVAVIEQNKRPYGKIEDGLPRWHVEQRKQEYGRIDARLKKPGVYFVPSTKLGRDLDFDDFCNNWGFSRGDPGERRVARPRSREFRARRNSSTRGWSTRTRSSTGTTTRTRRTTPGRATKLPTRRWWSAAGWLRSTW